MEGQPQANPANRNGGRPATRTMGSKLNPPHAAVICWAVALFLVWYMISSLCLCLYLCPGRPSSCGLIDSSLWFRSLVSRPQWWLYEGHLSSVTGLSQMGACCFFCSVYQLNACLLRSSGTHQLPFIVVAFPTNQETHFVLFPLRPILIFFEHFSSGGRPFSHQPGQEEAEE